MFPGRVGRGAVYGVALVLFLSTTSLAEPQPAASPAAESAEPALCPIRVSTYPLKGREDDIVFGLWSDDAAGKATGSIIAYAGGRRYRISFADAIAADNRNPAVLPTPIVVRFPSAVSIDSAYVESLSSDLCQIHSPFVSSTLLGTTYPDGVPSEKYHPGWARTWPNFLKYAAETNAQSAPQGEVADDPSCAKPYIKAYTKKAVPPVAPSAYGPDAEIIVGVEIAPDGSLLGMRIDASSIDSNGNLPILKAALDAAEQSQYAAEIYRCNPVSGNFVFYVSFNH
jgi:hypothetical protein